MQGNMNATPFGQAFLKKVAAFEGTLPENFFVYEAGWIEAGPPELWNTMRVKGCQFRAAKTGPNKGEICIPVNCTDYTMCVTKEEMRQAEIDMAAQKLDRINELKRKAASAHTVYMQINGESRHYTIGVCLHDTFGIWLCENTGNVVHMTVKYSDVPASAKFFELVEMK